MQFRTLGRLGTVSALAMGGGGIGGTWGPRTRAESVATVRAAVDAGITLIDVAPAYGAGEAVGSSRVDLQACKLEYSIVSPK